MNLPATLTTPRAGDRARTRPFTALLAAHRADVLSVSCLILAAIIFSLAVVRPVHAFIRGDWPAQFFPVYTYLGERLRAFDIPGWNPHQFSGAPFLGDPESGWMYLPAMALYAILPPEPATVTYIGFHIALAGIAIYAFARLLGLDVMGSLIAGASYALAWVAPGSMHLVIFFPAATWLVIALIGVTLAARAKGWRGRIWSWLFAAVAISQVLAIWLGQSSYYALMVISAWIVYETVVAPERPARLALRIRDGIITGTGVFGLGFLVSAASVLPRLDAVARSNLAGGVYDVASAWEASQIGFSFPEAIFEVAGGYTGSLWWYAGAVACALALMAPVVAFRWRPMPFFALLAAVSIVLSLASPTPLHRLLYALLPRFQVLHEHSPERILILVGPAVALLAGATTSFLPRWRTRRLGLLPVAAIPAILALTWGRSMLGPVNLLSTESAVIVVATSILVIAFLVSSSPYVERLALLGLLALALWDPSGRMALQGFVPDAPLERTLQESLGQDSAPFLYDNGPAAFLAAQTASSPARYAGFDPALLHDPATIETVLPEMGYRGTTSMKQPHVNRLLVYNWATWFGLDDVQGYNPIQVKRYVEYIDALNGHRQEYHERDLYPAGMSSPLLDLLNLRYVVTPEDAVRRTDIAPLLRGDQAVYEDEQIRIYENASALPRAWLVHEAEQVAPGEALPLLAEGTVDGSQVALLESPPPPLAPAADPAAERASYTHFEPDRIDITVSAQAPALLVLSEIWDPGWSATIDGEPAPVLLANHVLRAIPVPAGDSTVTLRYDPPLLRLGMALTALAVILAIGAAIWSAPRRELIGTKRSNRSS